VGTPHNTRNGPFKVLQLSDSLTNHSTVAVADRIKGGCLDLQKSDLATIRQIKKTQIRQTDQRGRKIIDRIDIRILGD
jgi:hypothetical protein